MKNAREYVRSRQIKIDMFQYLKTAKKHIYFCGIKIGKVMEWDFIKKYLFIRHKSFSKEKTAPLIFV